MRLDGSSATEIATSPEKLNFVFVSETGCEAYPDWQDNFIRIRDQELRRGRQDSRDGRWDREPCESACAHSESPRSARGRGQRHSLSSSPRRASRARSAQGIHEAAGALRLNPPPSRDRDGRRKNPCGQTRSLGACHCSKRSSRNLASPRGASAATNYDPLRRLPDPCQEWTLTGPVTVVHAWNRRFPYLLGAAS